MAYITLNQKNFNSNADYYVGKLKSKDKLCVALKDNAYGHGIKEIANFCFQYGIDNVMLRDIQEAQQIDNLSFKSILVLYDFPQFKCPENYVFAINSLETIKKFPKNTKVELKIDTGMSRNGISINEVLLALEEIEKYDLILNGVFTHFHSADEDDNSTIIQEEEFQKIIKQIKNVYKKTFRIHCCNTHGIHKVKNIDLYDMARIGIGIYGYSKYVKEELQPILSLYANKISTRTLNKNQTIGYGASYKIKDDNTVVSNYDVGYGSGFLRINENQNAHIQNGQKILGKVSMDSFSTFGNKDEICVFNNASHLAIVHDTIEYEILTHLMPTIHKKII